MKISKITKGEFEQNSISSLPIRPNESSRYGNAALSGEELKTMFDKNAELLRNKLNAVIDSISGEGELGIAAEIATGIPELPTLSKLCDGILNGALAATLTLTEEYTLLDFATKLLHLVSPETAVEFIKIEKKDGAYTLPDAPYPRHENAIYMLPSADSLSVFDCYIWNDGWQIWSTGSIQGYISGLEKKLNELYDTAAKAADLAYIKRIKADDADVLALSKKIDAMCAGTPIVFPQSFDALRASSYAKTDRIYLIKNSEDIYDGYWCYHDGSSWVTGGKYLESSGVSTEIQKYDSSPVSAGTVKEYVDNLLDEAFDGVARNYSGSLNLFDKNAVSHGKIIEDGTLDDDEDYITTDYLDITALYNIYISCTSANGYQRTPLKPYGYMFYTYEKSPIAGTYKFFSLLPYSESVRIDRISYPDARKMRVIFSRADYNAVTKVMIAPGETAKNYQPYVRYVMKIDSRMKPDSEFPVTNKALCEYIESKTHTLKWVFGDSVAYPVFDTVSNKLIFNPSASECEWGVILDGAHYHFLSGAPLEINISPALTPDADGNESNKGVIYLNTTLMKAFSAGTPYHFADCFFVRDSDYPSDDPDAIPIATFKRGENGFCAWMDCPFYIDGLLYGVCRDAQSTDSELESVKESVSELQSELDKATESIDTLTEANSSLNDNISILDGEISALWRKADETDTEVGGYDTRISAAEEKAEEAISNLNSFSEYYYMNDSLSINHAKVCSGFDITCANFLCIFDAYAYSTNSKKYIASFTLSGDVECRDNLRVQIYCPSCEEAPVFYFYNSYYMEMELDFTGDHCENGTFTPQANTEYTIKLWYQNKRYRAHVIAF